MIIIKKKEVDSYAIFLLRDYTTIGALYFEKFESTWESLSITKDLIDSYNRNLVGRDLPNCIFAHRFLEQENAERTLCPNDLFSKIKFNSRKHVVKNYPSYDMPHISDEEDTIAEMALISSDIFGVELDTKRKIEIDLDDKIVTLTNIFEARSVKAYCKENKLNIHKFDKTALPEFNMNELYFNEIDEGLNFLLRFPSWQREETDLVYSSIDTI